MRKLLVINLVGLNEHALQHMPGLRKLFSNGGRTYLEPSLPAVTCTSQATITTGSLPREHGIVSNGWFFRDAGEARCWMRSDGLVHGVKIWDELKAAEKNASVANLFWRYCTHANCDVTVTERPTYWADGRKGPDIYAAPHIHRDQLVERLGEFPLFRFWGPATSIESTNWIANTTAETLRHYNPDLALTYLPHLDYDLQKYGPNDARSIQACADVDATATKLAEQAMEQGRETVVLSEYGITEVSRPVYLNRVLRDASFISVQNAKNGELLEPSACAAFALCSHQVAHVYVNQPENLSAVRQLLETTEGVERVLGELEKQELGLDHPRAGELIAIAAPDSWFAYPYWLDDDKAPDFARCVAIHDKPGHDPCEMFLGPGGKGRVLRRLAQSKLGFRVPFDVISLDANLVRGSHGRLPSSEEEGPLMLTSWQHDDKTKSMADLKRFLLSRMLD